jgi:hypothetical protein
MKVLVPLCAFGLLALLRPWSHEEPATPFDPARALASLAPGRCHVYVEVPGAGEILGFGLAHPSVEALKRSPLGESFLHEHPGAIEQALARAEDWLGAPVLPALAALAGRGLALGFDPAVKKTVLVTKGESSSDVERVLELGFDALERQFDAPGLFDRANASWSGADVWWLGEDGVIAHRAELVVLGNDRELVRACLELAADPEARGLSAHPGFEEQRRSLAAEATAFAWLELAELDAHGDEGYRALRAANRAPAVQGLLGAELAALLSARALALTLTLHETGLELRVRAHEATGAAALRPVARSGERPPELGGENLASALLYRDYSRFLTERAALFPSEVQGDFAEAVTNGALFFEGQDIGAEVLAHLSPWLRLVARPVEFAPERVPEIPLPALAVVGVLDEARAGEAWLTAFQTLLALLNVERAQQGGKGMRLQLQREGEIEITTARFATPGPGDGVDVRYNLEPAVTVVGRHLVLGTHVGLVRELVRELAGAEPVEPEARAEELVLQADSVRTFVERNLAALVAHKQLSEGLAHEAAEGEIELLRLALASLEGLRLTLDGAQASAPELKLELTFTQPR